MGRPPAKDLTERELEVMHTFWRHGEATAAAAHDRLAAAGLDRTYTTIANLVRALADKGFLRQVNNERPFLYQAVRSYEEVSGRLLGDLLQARLPGVACATVEAARRATEADGRGARPAPAGLEGARPMNDLGLTVAWSAVQVSLVLVPAVVLHGLASRRSPASGAWVASMSLGLVVAFNLLSLAPRGWTPRSATVSVARQRSVAASGRVDQARGDSTPAGEPAGDHSRFTLTRLRAVWERFERTAAEPAARCRPWGTSLALACLTGIGVGLLRLLIGLWAVHRCRRRSCPVDDTGLARLLKEVRTSMGCRRRVEIRETPDLTAPATAGWWHAVILLPADWRSWDRHESRAVFAHELAHVCRDDYVTGIVARVALALHFYHPLVHWLSARLQLEQELAADALGARFAGGKRLYLQSLSRLALRQDGRPPCWPARAFLPANQTLIRRIAMLRAETNSSDRPWSGPRRTLAALLLLAVAAATSLLHGPARGDDAKKDDGVKAAASTPGPTTRNVSNPSICRTSPTTRTVSWRSGRRPSFAARAWPRTASWRICGSASNGRRPRASSGSTHAARPRAAEGRDVRGGNGPGLVVASGW